MTTKFMDTYAIPLTKVNTEYYCHIVDVLKLIHHEYFETDNKELRDIFDRMEMRVSKGAFVGFKQEEKTCPPRYGVGKETKDGWLFFVDSKDEKPLFSDRPCMAKRYLNYRDASACADFLDGEWDVLDFESSMSEEERWQRALLMPMPFDADDGNENAIPVEVVT